jgi:hypothetical protein
MADTSGVGARVGRGATVVGGVAGRRAVVGVGARVVVVAGAVVVVVLVDVVVATVTAEVTGTGSATTPGGAPGRSVPPQAAAPTSATTRNFHSVADACVGRWLGLGPPTTQR